MNLSQRSTDSPDNDRWQRRLCVFGIVGFAIIAKLYTGHVWEDFLITFRHSENLVAGHGLVYQVGERTHGFTSPLNVLLPAITQWFIPAEGYSVGLWGFTLTALAVWWWGLNCHLKLIGGNSSPSRRYESLLLVLFTALQVKLVQFAIAGQEAGLWAGFLLLAFGAIVRGVSDHWRILGVAAAGLLWTRPDSPVHIILLAIAALAFRNEPLPQLRYGLLKAAALCTVLYLPWFAWAWWYYGTPVPHTIIAKMNVFPGAGGAAARIVSFISSLPAAMGGAFEAIYAESGGWPSWIRYVACGSGIICSTYWLVPGADRIGRIASFLFCGSAMYLACIRTSGMIYPWYFVPCGTFGAIVLARLGSLNLGVSSRLRRYVASTAVLALISALGFQTAWSLPLLKLRQEIVEEKTRRQVGLWLRAHQSPEETVFLEPIGYIGYYAGTHVLDFPGLVSPSVVSARRTAGRGMVGSIKLLQPDWLVVRPEEARAILGGDLKTVYEFVIGFDSYSAVAPYHEIPGFPFLASDTSFAIYRRSSNQTKE